MFSLNKDSTDLSTPVDNIREPLYTSALHIWYRLLCSHPFVGPSPVCMQGCPQSHQTHTQLISLIAGCIFFCPHRTPPLLPLPTPPPSFHSTIGRGGREFSPCNYPVCLEDHLDELLIRNRLRHDAGDIAMGSFRISCDEEGGSPLNEDREMLLQNLRINDITGIFS